MIIEDHLLDQVIALDKIIIFPMNLALSMSLKRHPDDHVLENFHIYFDNLVRFFFQRRRDGPDMVL